MTASATLGLYHASKWALEGLNQALSQEVEAFGIKVTLIEPAGYATDWSGTSARHAISLPAYDPLRQQRKQMAGNHGQADPHATADAILAIVDADDPPLRFLLGSAGLPLVRQDYEARLDAWEAWRKLSASAE